MKYSLIVLVSILLVSFVSLVSAANGCFPADPECGPTPTDNCDVRQTTIFTPATYYMQNGIDICVNDSGLDCGGAVLQYPGTTLGTTTAIYLDGIRNFVIDNCNIKNFKAGIVLTGSSQNTIMNNEVSYNLTTPNDGWGIRIISSHTNNIYQNNVTGFGIGILSWSSINSVINDNVASRNNGIGIDIGPFSNNVTVTNNIASQNLVGIQLPSNSISNNISSNVAILNQYYGIDISGTSSFNIIDKNIVCFTNGNVGSVDINKQGMNQGLNFGDNNACSTTLNWNDNDSIGCTFPCSTNISVIGSVSLGNSFELSLLDPAYPNTPYVAGLSFGTFPGIPLGDGRTIPLNNDPLLQLSLNSILGPAMGFQNFTGVLDWMGRATAHVSIPNISGLSGLSFYSAFISINTSSLLPQSVLSISQPLRLTIT